MINKQALLDWLKERRWEIDKDRQYARKEGLTVWKDELVEKIRLLNELEHEVRSGRFDALSDSDRLRAALEEVYEELKTLHFMIDHDDDIFHERKKKYLSIIDYVGQSVAGQSLSTTTDTGAERVKIPHIEITDLPYTRHYCGNPNCPVCGINAPEGVES